MYRIIVRGCKQEWRQVALDRARVLRRVRRTMFASIFSTCVHRMVDCGLPHPRVTPRSEAPRFDALGQREKFPIVGARMMFRDEHQAG